MSFSQLSGGTVALGLLGLAALLFLLQRLRIRYREVTVPTLLFWQQAIEETRARVFVRRFRHPWAYLLILALGSLLILALSGPELPTTGREGQRVLLLDGSAAMARGDRFAQSSAAVLRAAKDHGAESLQVVFCGASPQPLLGVGEDLVVLERRLETLRPEPVGCTLSAVVEEIVRTRTPDQPLDIVVFGAAEVPADFMSMLPEDTRVTRGDPPVVDDERVLLSDLGHAAAQSGERGRIDLLVGWRGRLPITSAKIRVGDRELTSTDFERIDDDGDTRVLVRDLPADGSVVQVAAFSGDGVPDDERGTLRLPAARPMRLRVDAILPEPIEALLAAAGNFDLVREGDADLVLGRTSGADFEIAADLEPQAPIQVITDGSPGEALALFDGIGLDEVFRRDADRGAGPSSAELTVTPGPQRRVIVAESLLTPEWNFAQTESFPLFMARALRWLADAQNPPERCATGEPLGRPGEVFRAPTGWELDGVGLAGIPTVSGAYRRADGSTLEVSSLAGPSRGAADLAPSRTLDSSRRLDLVTLCGLLALALLFVEWTLHRRGRIP
ncbi:MAG: VWA domain-containing protein [Planctomycetes bacterium]|nr:VWA domain-containing protein [Planctomycetota bacterium]